jgi:hypothetical protein
METVTRLEDALGKAVRCTDGDLRLLREIATDFVSYDVPLTEDHWMPIGLTYRRHKEMNFASAHCGREQ